MSQALLQHVAATSMHSQIPLIETGMSVVVSQKIKEGEKERVQNFDGLVIATNGGRGVAATFTVRKIVGGIGVEKIFPLHGKNIVKIEVLKKAKVRRSKLYYMRERHGKAARMSETHVREVVHSEAAPAESKKAESEAEAPQKASPPDEKAEKPAAEKDSKKEPTTASQKTTESSAPEKK